MRLPSSHVRRGLAAPVLAALVASGCFLPLPLPGGRALSRQMVVRKEGENLLVAFDGSTCRVRGDVYKKVQVGDDHTCVWQDPRADSAAVSQPGPTRDPSPPRTPGRPSLFPSTR